MQNIYLPNNVFQLTLSTAICNYFRNNERIITCSFYLLYWNKPTSHVEQTIVIQYPYWHEFITYFEIQCKFNIYLEMASILCSLQTSAVFVYPLNYVQMLSSQRQNIVWMLFHDFFYFFFFNKLQLETLAIYSYLLSYT